MNINIFPLKLKLLCSSMAFTGTYLILATSVLAQITPDNTLPNNSVIDNSQPRITRIIEGTTRGKNLFHSFSQFSVKNGTTAYFDNPLTIENIFTRITGKSISNIDGIIKANGSANLFLLNPNGIIFTENARLDIGGSFIGSTANSIKFVDGTEFSASNPDSQPLLSINLPSALQFTSNPSPITVQGQGNIQDIDPDTYAVLDIIAEGLEVPKGKTLALVGGNLNLTGGNLKAESGSVELGSIQGESTVELIPNNSGWSLNYEGVKNFQDITFEQAASINTTGESGGDVKLQGNNIMFKDGSTLLANTEGEGSAGNVIITASKLLELSGNSPKELPLPSAILTETTGKGSGGKVTINAGELALLDGAQISSTTFDKGLAGNINVKADSIKLIGISPFLGELSSALASATNDRGKAGNVTIDTKNLSIQDGAQINVLSFGSGKGGNIIINALESIEISGIQNEISSGLFSQTQSSGDAGDIIVNTGKLTLEKGGRISSRTFVSGKGGNITINASDSITLEGSEENAASSILASALSPPPFVPIQGTGDGGHIKITTPKLDIINGAQISVGNFDSAGNYAPGIGKPGDITIKVNQLTIDRGKITTEAYNENGGNINLGVNELTILKHQGIITATAGIAQEFGNGGNVELSTQFIVSSDSSKIIANAFKGNGGNINLSAEGIFITPDTTIEASSQFGIDGTVKIETPNTNPTQGLVERKQIIPPPQIARGCNIDEGMATGSFSNTGKGGIPTLATDNFQGNNVWEDLRPLPSPTKRNTNLSIPPNKPLPQPIREAQGWQWKDNKRDTVIFISNPEKVTPQSSLSSSIYCKNYLHN